MFLFRPYFRNLSCNSFRGVMYSGRHRPHQSHSHHAQIVRTLFTPAALGLDQYQLSRDDTSKRFTGKDQLFKKRMSELLDTQENCLVFTEDFKNILHLVEDCEEDLSLMRKMARRFNQQNEGLRFGMYLFGPVVMRTYHTLKKPQEALEALNDPGLSTFFDQIMTFQVLMDLLYKEGMYNDVLNVFESLQERRIGGVKYHKNCLTLTLAACYKLNTEESFKYQQSLLTNMEEYGTNLNLKMLAFSSALALSQHHPSVALDLILKATYVTHIIVRSIKVMSLSHLGRFQEAILTLRSIAENDKPNDTNKYITRHAVEALQEAVLNQGGTKEESVQLKRIIKNLEDFNRISNETVDDLICKPIDKFDKNRPPDREMLKAAFVRPPPPHHLHNHTANRHTDSHPPPLPHRRLGLIDRE